MTGGMTIASVEDPSPYTEKVCIGRATLYLGDARDIVPTLGVIDSVVTDPPYGMAWQSSSRPKHLEKRHRSIAGDKDTGLLEFASRIPVTHSRYVFTRWDVIVNDPSSLIVWIKNNHGMGNLDHEHSRATEYLMFWPGDDHAWPDKRPADVLHAARVNSDVHPTEKPVPLMAKIVSWTRGTVLDPFMGSGSTGVACVEAGRDFLGIELDRQYFDAACERISAADSQGTLF